MRSRTALLTSTPSDAHTWNLMFLQLVLEEAGFLVRNLGSCSPIAVVLRACQDLRPDLLVVSSVNGHGRVEGAELISAIRPESNVRAVIGGMLTTGRADPEKVRAELTGLGYEEVFTGESALPDFHLYLESVSAPAGADAG
jgi:methylmalonyl-CoA mutase cobalamin-binding subunit